MEGWRGDLGGGVGGVCDCMNRLELALRFEIV